MPQETSLNSYKTTRVFTDREEPQESFLKLLNKEQRYRVLHFYGIGGIGKSALMKHLKNKHLEGKKDTIYSYVNFEDSSRHDKSKALRVLAKRFRDKFGVKFPLFYTAYAIYWSKINPDLELTNLNKIPFLNEGSILTGVAGIFDNGISSIALNALSYLYEKFGNFISVDYKEDIKKFPQYTQENMENRLSLYFCIDLRNHIIEKELKNCVIFMDTIETLTEAKNRQKNDR